MSFRRSAVLLCLYSIDWCLRDDQRISRVIREDRPTNLLVSRSIESKWLLEQISRTKRPARMTVSYGFVSVGWRRLWPWPGNVPGSSEKSNRMVDRSATRLRPTRVDENHCRNLCLDWSVHWFGSLADWCTRTSVFQIYVEWSKTDANEIISAIQISDLPCKPRDVDVRLEWLFQPFRSEVRRPEQKVFPIYLSLEFKSHRELIEVVRSDLTIIRMTLSENESNMVLAHIFCTDREWNCDLNSSLVIQKRAVGAEFRTRKVSFHFGLSVLIQTIERCKRSVVQFTPTFSKP